MKFHLTLKAFEDLKGIARYTQEIWGTRQRDVYLNRIDETFYFIAEDPNRGRSCNDIRQGYFKYSVGKHIIFYRQINKEIQIVRILHGSMDIPNHF